MVYGVYTLEAEMRPLYPHQAAAMEYAKDRRDVALFMEMRLGKTVVAIRWAPGERVLVVAPLTVIPGWVRELRIESIPDNQIHELTGSYLQRIEKSKAFVPGVQNWYLINYEGLRVCPELADTDWSTVICDESTRIRNPKAQITKLIVRRFGRAVNRAILSGLPAPEGPMDYYTQMQFLHGGFMGTSNYWAWRQKYFHPDMRGYDWVPNPGAVEAIKKEVHRSAFVLTRKQAGMGNKKIYERRYVEMSPELKAAAKRIRKDFVFDMKDGSPALETKWATTQALWLARLAGGFSPDQQNPRLLCDTKIREVVDLLKGELKGQRVVLWFRFNEELHAVRNALLDAKLGPLMAVTGETDPAHRGQIEAAFGKGTFPILLMQEKIGQFGMNLSAASTAIYYSNWWDYEVRAQSEDRIEHMQKSEPLLYIDLVMRGTPDEEAVEALQEKKLTARQFMQRMISYLAQEWRAEHGQGESSQAVAAPVTLRARVRKVQR